MTKITKSIVSITLTTIMITSTMAIKANAANTNQELKWRNDTYYSTSTFNAYNKTFSTYVKNGSKKRPKYLDIIVAMVTLHFLLKELTILFMPFYQKVETQKKN